MQNTDITNNNRSQHTPLDLEVNLPNRKSHAENQGGRSPLGPQALGKGTFDMYQTLIDLQHGNDQIKRKSTASASGVDGAGLHSAFNASGTGGRQPSYRVPLQSKINALDVLTQSIVVDKRITIGAFVDCMMQLFAGLESCLRTQQLQVLQAQYESELKGKTNSEIVIDIVLKANQFLFEIMPDIQSSRDLEIQMANLIPIFIENLGSPKAVVRKSTHKCIGTYVKLTKKLEFVLRHIIQTGLENQNSRTRQHSMLVIPALLSLKASIMDSVKQEMADLLRAVISRIQSDSSEIVAKTGKKLVLELQKCYPTQFKQNYVDRLGDNREMQICQAIIGSDDAELKMLLSQPQTSQKAPLPLSSTTTPPSGLAPHGKGPLSQMHQKNELSSIGREIMMNIPQQINPAPTQQQAAPAAFANNSRAAPATQEVTPKSIERPGIQSLEPAKSPTGLVFGFLHHETIDALDESNAWKDRATAIERVESQLSHELSNNERKTRFVPHATAFLGFIMAHIKDMNFKVSLTAINITNKLLVLEVAQVNKHYNNLARNLIEKLSDSKVVIRQAVLKCCSVLIRGSSPSQFANHAISYLGHTNWHVREGILHLIANCLIVQAQQDELNGNRDGGKVGLKGEDASLGNSKDLAISQILIGQLCQMAQNEIKVKIQQMVVDDLALCIEISKDPALTEQIIQRELGIQSIQPLNPHEETQANRLGRELFNQIKQRQNTESVPAMQIDGSIEFKPVDPLVLQHGESFAAKSRGDFKPSGLDYQFSPSRRGDGDDRHAHKTQQPSMLVRVRGTPPVDTEEHKPSKLQAKSIDHPTATKRNQPLSSESAVNEKIQTWLPSFKSGQDKEKMTEGSELSYDPQGAFQGTKRRTNGGATGVNSGYDNAAPTNSNQSSLNNIRRQTSLPKGPQTTALSTVGVPDDVSGIGAATVHAEPLSAGLRLSNNNLRNLSQHVDNNIEIDRNIKLNSDLNQPFNSEQRLEKLMQGYTPIQHHQKPRIIQSNEIRQRTLENVSIAQASPSPKLGPRTGMAKNDFVSLQQSPMLTNDTKSQVGEPSSLRAGAITGYNPQPGSSQTDMKVMQVRNMSQSSGAPGGFGVNKAAINERLQLLKSTFKYKNQSEHETQSNLGDARTFDNTDRRLKYDAGNTGKKANSEYNAREDTKLPAVTTLNNNNYMMQTGGGVSGVSGSQVSAAMSGAGGSGKAIEKPQQTLNSFALSNVSTNVNNFNGAKSYSANKQLQSTNTTGYNFGASGHDSKTGGLRRDLNMNQYNAYESTLLESHNLNRSGLEKSQGKNASSGMKGSNKGPIKATPIPQPQMEYMNTIQVEQNIRNGSHYTSSHDQVHLQNQRPSNNATSVKSEQAPPANVNRKPPVSKGSLNSLNQQQMQQQILQQRASSVSANMQLSDSSMARDNFQTPKKSWNGHDEKPIQPQGMQNPSALGPNGTQTATHYNAPEEPLRNPEAQFKQSVQDLKSQDWQKIFDGLNVIKRVAQFHKELLVMTSSPLAKEAIKAVVKQTESLRSQISKNACMTLQVVYSELPTRDLDSNMELVMHALLKKSTDTNHFVSEQAEKALMMVCHACSETKVLNCIQMAEGKGPSFRQKVALSYCFLIEKLGARIRNYKDSQRIVKAVVNMLGEGAAEARNQAKIGVAQIKNNIQNGREFDGLLMRSGLTDQQIEQAKKVADQGEYNSLNQVNNTRYGGSMRGSSMDSRAHGSEAQRRTPHVFPNNLAMGSDGFSSQNFTDQKMQQTFLSGGAHAAAIDTSPGSIYSNNMQSNAFGMTNTSHHPSFKKRQTSMSKPIDPALMEEFKGLVQQCNTHDWTKRLQSIDQLDSWVQKNQTIIKQAPAAKFIQLVDIKCKMIQDNNAKVQGKALTSFKDFLMNDSLQHLKEQNLTIIVQGIAASMTSSQPSVRLQTEQLMSILEETIDNKSHLIQPIIAQLNLQNCKSKVQLVQRLSALLPRIEQTNVMERYVQPLVRSNHKIQSEATLNPKLRDALRQLEVAYQQVIKR